MKRLNRGRDLIRAVCLSAALSALPFAAVTAYAMNATMTFSDPTASVGEEVPVTFRVTSISGEKLGNANIMLSYDASVLEFVGGEHVEGGAGSLHVTGMGGSADDWKYELTFKALKGGTASITVSTAEIYDGDGKLATIAHQGSSKVQISGADGETAAAGESSGETASAAESGATLSDEPVYLTIDGVQYEAAQSFDSTLLPAGYEAGQFDLNGSAVMAGRGADENLRILYLLGADGSGNLYYYDTRSGVCVPYVEVGSLQKTVTAVPADPDLQVPDTLVPNRLTLNGKPVSGWLGREDDGANYCVFYGMNQDGEKNFYRFDLAEKTIQRYFNETPPAVQQGGTETPEGAAVTPEYDALMKKYRTRGWILIALGVLSAVLALLHLLRGHGGEPERGREPGLDYEERGSRDSQSRRPAEEDASWQSESAEAGEAAGVTGAAGTAGAAAAPEEAAEDDSEDFEDIELFEDIDL